MATLLMGHGQVLTDQEIVVPDGMTITFMIDENRTMPFSNAVGLVLNSASLASAGFHHASSHNGGDWIHNHILYVLTDAQRSWYAQVDPEDGTCWYAGDQLPDGVRLCEDPGRDGQCAGGVHTCGGILSMALPSPDIFWVSCRQDPAATFSKGQRTFGSEANGDAEAAPFDAFAKDALTRLQTDRANFAAYFDGLSEDQVAILMSQIAIRKWSYQRQARIWLEQGTTAEQFYAYVAGQDLNEQEIMLSGGAPYLDPPTDLLAVFEQGQFVREARNYLESHGATNFRLWVNELSSDDRAVLAAYPELAAAMAVPGHNPASPESQESRFGITVDQIDWPMVQAVSERELKEAADGAQVPFWQLPTGEVAIGMGQSPTYRKLIEMVRDGNGNPTGEDYNGRITVHRAHIGAGTLEVTGALNADTMRDWIGAFSKKEVEFV